MLYTEISFLCQEALGLKSWKALETSSAGHFQIKYKENFQKGYFLNGYIKHNSLWFLIQTKFEVKVKGLCKGAPMWIHGLLLHLSALTKLPQSHSVCIYLKKSLQGNLGFNTDRTFSVSVTEWSFLMFTIQRPTSTLILPIFKFTYWKQINIVISFLIVFSTWGQRGDVLGFGVLLLWLVSESYPE